MAGRSEARGSGRGHGPAGTQDVRIGPKSVPLGVGVRLGALGLRTADRYAVAFHPRVEGAPGNAEKRSGLRLVPLRAIERLADQTVFDLLEAEPQREQI